MSRLRVLVVEDSITVRMRLCEVLNADPGIDLVGQASDGKQAIELCQSLRPDVISMDMMLPVMSGLAATEYIMAYCPTPILIVSASFNRGEVFKTYEALAAGAVELMEKPGVDDVEGDWDRRYLIMLKLVARIRVVTHLRGRMAGYGESTSMPLNESTSALTSNSDFFSNSIAGSVAISGRSGRHHKSIQVIAIGASTGGPGALVKVLRGLPADLAVPVLIVIHIGEPFGIAFAEWLDTQTTHRVKVATDGQWLNKPGVFIAPGNLHLSVLDRRLHISDGPERHSCRPSVDVLFESVASEFGPHAVACLLTGMGHDGARGLLAVHQTGGITIAQDEATCVVYGMPREAVLLGAAQRILPVQDIGSAIAELVAASEGACNG